MVDVKSLYPTVVGGCVDEKNILGFVVDYPIGKPEWVETQDASKIGFYECTIKGQKEEIMNVIPLRGETLDWKYKGEIKCVLSSVDIEVIKNHHGSECVEVGKGIEFPD